MKNTLLIICVLLSAQFAFGQSYTTQFDNLPSTPGNGLIWEASGAQPDLKFMTTKNGFIGEVLKAKIFVENELTYRIERKGNRYFLANAQKETRLVRHANAYLTIDGTELRKTRNGTGDKIRIIHPDGRILAEGKIKSKILGDHTLSLEMVGDSPYHKEILAMLSIDLLEQLRDRGDYIQPGYTATVDK